MNWWPSRWSRRSSSDDEPSPTTSHDGASPPGGVPRARRDVKKLGRFPVLVHRAGLFQGPVRMRLETDGERRWLVHAKTGEEFDVTGHAPRILKHRSKRTVGYVVDGVSLRALGFDTPRTYCELKDGMYEATPDLLSAKLDTRAVKAMSLAVKPPTTLILALLGGGAGVGFFLLAIVGQGTEVLRAIIAIKAGGSP